MSLNGWKKFIQMRHEHGRCEFSGYELEACAKSVCNCSLKRLSPEDLNKAINDLIGGKP